MTEPMKGDIREATHADVPSLEVVRRQAIEAGFTDEYERSDFADHVARPDASLPEWLASETHLAVLAETEVTVVGYGVLDRQAATIRALYTAPAYQESGCASALLDRFERVARDTGATTLHVASPANAVGFFERLGFEQTGTVHRDGLQLVTMEKSLTRASL